MSAGMRLTPALASRFAAIALAGIAREYPNKLDHVLSGDGCLLPPRRLHPAFFGCFDWHSAVHTHWLLARLLRLHPDLPEAHAIESALDQSLTPANISAECAYLQRPNTGSFERTYGWAWLLKLAEELSLARGRAWGPALSPLADAFIARYLDYLPRAGYPIRTGTHANTAFGLSFARDFAVARGHDPLRRLIDDTALAFFKSDADAPAHLEPGGADFFSPTLIEADLMRRLLSPVDFAVWFARFLPRGLPPSITQPAAVSDRRDLQIVHLDGLNLSRAWCMRAIARALPESLPARAVALRAAETHLDAALPHIQSGHYGGEHWLATFAVLALTGA